MWTSRFVPNPTPCGRTRREFLWEVGQGFAGLALFDLLSRDASAADISPLAAKPPHFAAKAKHARTMVGLAPLFIRFAKRSENARV